MRKYTSVQPSTQVPVIPEGSTAVIILDSSVDRAFLSVSSDFLMRTESIWHGESLVVTLWEGWQARNRGCRRSYKCQSYS